MKGLGSVSCCADVNGTVAWVGRVSIVNGDSGTKFGHGPILCFWKGHFSEV